MQQYLDKRLAIRRSAPASTRLAEIGRLAVPGPLRDAAKVLATRALAPRERQRAKSLIEGGRRRIHLGCGATRLEGWINIDLLGTRADLFWDVTRPLPFPGASLEAIFHEHMIEHLPFREALALTRECYRVLRPDGVLRLAMPDFQRYAESYRGDGRFIEDVRPGRPSRLLALQEVFYEHGHRSVWDPETLGVLMTEAGFENFEVSSFRGSPLGMSIDSQGRQAESLYVEAVKAARDHRAGLLRAG